MAQVLYEQCLAGQCDHAPFPHKIVIVPASERRVTRLVPDAQGNRTRQTVTLREPEQTFVICLKCGHWPNSSKADQCFCKFQCHQAAQLISIP